MTRTAPAPRTRLRRAARGTAMRIGADPAERIAVQRATRAADIPSDRKFRLWARATHTGPLEIAVRIVGSKEGRELNRRFRKKDYATNVLSFDYRAGAARLQGDIVLCAPVVRREAREQGKALEAHYAHLLVHGVLHLAGHDHESGAEAARMERAERRILGRLGYPDPYAAHPASPA